jgi:hypothetical protein
MIPTTEATFVTIVAGVVTASSFQLLNATGAIVAELTFNPGNAGLSLWHLDTVTPSLRSELVWSTLQAGDESVELKGPTSPFGGSPNVHLERRAATGSSVSIDAASRARILVSDTATGGHIDINPDQDGALTGRLSLGGRDGYLPLGDAHSVATGNWNPVNGVFQFVPGVSINLTLVAGDQVACAWVMDSFCGAGSAADHIVCVRVQDPIPIVTIPPQQAIHRSAAAGHRGSFAQRALFTCVNPGVHNFSLIQQMIGAGNFLGFATNTALSTAHLGIR